MKKIKYYLHRVNEDEVEETYEKVITYSEENEEIAKMEAHNGEYTIFDDGEPDPVVAPSQLDTIEAQATYTAMMTDTLLEV